MMSRSSARGPDHPPAGQRSLEPGDFSFAGFGELRWDELRKLSKLSIRSDPPAVSVVEDAIFVPGSGEALSRKTKLIGGIVKPDGSPIDTAQLHRKGGKHFGGLTEAVSVAVEGELDEDVVYLGPLFTHYGRVLLESLARVWYLSEVDPCVKVIFNHTATSRDGHLVQAEYPPWVFRLLSLFGIPTDRILALERPTRLRRAIVPEPLFEQLFSAHVEMVRPFREVAARIAGDVTMSRQPLYLSRRRLTSRERPVVGEPELEELLRKNGFAIAYPETMTFDDQIRLINAHADIVSSIGSAAHTILFALGKPRLHLLAHRESISGNFFLCSAIADVPTTFVDCLGSGGRASPKAERRNREADSAEIPLDIHAVDTVVGPQSVPQLLEWDRVVSYLDQTGFLASQSPPGMLDPDALTTMKRRHDEAWFYTRLRLTARRLGSLSADLEREALDLAAESWPISFVLAVYYAGAGDNSGADTLASQFATLLDRETDVDRLAYFRGDIHELAGQLAAACQPATANRLASILSERLPWESLDD